MKLSKLIFRLTSTTYDKSHHAFEKLCLNIMEKDKLKSLFWDQQFATLNI